MPRAKEIFPHAILGARAVGLSDLLHRVNLSILSKLFLKTAAGKTEKNTHVINQNYR